MIEFHVVLEVTRGEVVESVHHGAIAISDSTGALRAWHGDPGIITFMRSSAKPLQALLLIESGAVNRFSLSDRHIAIACASHNGTDEHVAAVESLLDRIGSCENDLHCGIHPPFDKETKQRLVLAGQAISPLRNNCSGKHAGMLAAALALNESKGDYECPEHPVQKRILGIMADMCGLEAVKIQIGIDGCTVPTFAVPLHTASSAFARLVDPSGMSATRAQACDSVVSAMTIYPDLVAGSNRFDTRLMQATKGRIVSKSGAEGFQALGIRPGDKSDGSPGLGVAIKIADGDYARRARSLVSLEVLRMLNVLPSDVYADLAQEAAVVRNNRDQVVGRLRPMVRLMQGVQ